MASNVIPFPRLAANDDSGVPPSSPESLALHAPFAQGIEAAASLIEIRLALHFYWQHHSKDEWKLHQLQVGRA